MRLDKRTHRRALAAVGSCMIVGAVLWRTIGVPELQEIPAGHKQTVQLDGKLDLHFDPWTLNPVVPPRTLEFKMEQVGTTEPGPNHSIAVNIRQTSQASAAVNTESVNRYILDPKTRRNLDSDEAWAYEPSNVVDRAPAYSLSLPPGLDPDRSYPWFEPTTDRILELEPAGERSEVSGVDLVAFHAAFAGAASRAYLMNLDAFGLPATLSVEELYRMSPEKGVDPAMIEGLRGALPGLPLELRRTVEDALNAIIPVSYRVTGDLVFDFEPRTGALVRVRSVSHELVAHADLSGLEAASAALRNWDDPLGDQIAAQFGPLETMAELPVFTYDLAQTRASAVTVAQQVQRELRTLALLGIWLPLVLGVAGIAFVGIAVIRGRRDPGTMRVLEGDGDVDAPEDDQGLARDEAAASHADTSQPAAAVSRQSRRGESDQSFSSL